MSDFINKLEEAPRRKTLKTLMDERGRATGKKCPYCQKDSASLFQHEAQWW